MARHKSKAKLQKELQKALAANKARNQQKKAAKLVPPVTNAPVATGIAANPAPRGKGVVCMNGSSIFASYRGKFTDGQVLCNGIVQPSNIDTLRHQADVFQFYRFKKLRAVIIVDTPTTSHGMLTAGFIHDPADDLPEESTALQNMIDSQPGAKRGKVWEKIVVNAHTPSAWLYTSQSVELRQSAAYRLAVAHIGLADSESTFQVKLEYEVEFCERTLAYEHGALNLTPTIRSNIVIGTEDGYTALRYGHPAYPNVNTKYIGNDALEMFDFPFPVLTSQDPDKKYVFRWRANIGCYATKPNSSGTDIHYNIRDVIITNESGKWYAYGAEAGCNYAETNWNHNVVWLTEGDVLTPIPSENPMTAAATADQYSALTAAKNPFSEGWRPVLSSNSVPSSVLKAYSKAGLTISTATSLI